MSNEYFTSPADVAPVTRARSGDVNGIDRAVDAAFDKLPSELAMKSGTINYAVDAGTEAGAYVVALPSRITALGDGLEVVMRSTRTNAGPATLNVNGIGAIPVKRVDGSSLVAGDILENSPITMRYVAATKTFVSARGDSITRTEVESMIALGASPGSVAITSLGKGSLQPMQVVRLNAAGTSLEGASVAAGTDLAMVHAIALSF